LFRFSLLLLEPGEIYFEDFSVFHYPSELSEEEAIKRYLFNVLYYCVAPNLCGSLILQMGDFLCLAETNFCDWQKLVFLAGN